MKVRRVDLYPDEFLAAIAGEMTPAELGVYWMICLLHYSHGSEVEPELVRKKFRATGANKDIGAITERFIKGGRVYRIGAQLGVSRCAAELQRALSRIAASVEHGRRGGRPRKEINEIEKGSPFFKKTLTNNYQPSTTKEEEIDESISPSRQALRTRALNQEFEAIWWIYPRRVAKGAAKKAWHKARQSADATTLREAIERYAAEKRGTDEKYIPHLSKWLNQEQWLDGEPEPQGGINGRYSLPGPTEPAPSPEEVYGSRTARDDPSTRH